jgi:hypothetical protein
MKRNLFLFCTIVIQSALFFSCAKTSDISPTPSGSRAIKYEITGNYSGIITLVCTTNNDDFEIMEIKKLPWKLEFTAKQSITFVGGSASGGGGVSGQTATLKTFVGGQEVSSGAGTALSSGFLNLTNKIYILK